MQHIVGKLSTRATTLLQNSSQSKVCTQNYGPPKSRKSQLWKFRDSHLGVPGQNVIWMWASWRGTKYIIRGKVVASPKSKLWWVLWVRIWPWLVLALKMLKLCINQLVVWFMQVRVGDKVFVIFLNPIPELQHTLPPPKCCELGNVSLILCSSVVFTLDSH
jgi:hypothetical protein